MDRDELLRHLDEDSQVLNNPAIKDAFVEIDRRDFLDEDYKPEAYEDYAVPIGFEETLTKPTVAAFMLELLELQPGDRVLNIGAGSGWTTALIAKIVGEEGFVWATEIVPELAEKSRANLAKYNFSNFEIIEAEKEIMGYPQDEPYDKILVHASVNEIPQALIGQVKVGGIVVVPVEDSIVKVERVTEDEIEEQAYDGFMFNPMITAATAQDLKEEAESNDDVE